MKAKFTESLASWVLENKSAPASWLVLAHRLLDAQDMQPAWHKLEKSGDKAMIVFGAACNAFERAEKEGLRQPAAEELTDIELVISRAKALKTAIQQSSLPKRWGALVTLAQPEAPDIDLMVGWQDVPDFGAIHTLEIVQLLDLTVAMAGAHIQALPIRAVTRRRARPVVDAFVRWLAWDCRNRVAGATPDVLARLTNAALDLTETQIGVEDVKKILKGQPKAFNRGFKTAKNLR